MCHKNQKKRNYLKGAIKWQITTLHLKIEGLAKNCIFQLNNSHLCAALLDLFRFKGRGWFRSSSTIQRVISCVSVLFGTGFTHGPLGRSSHWLSNFSNPRGRIQVNSGTPCALYLLNEQKIFNSRHFDQCFFNINRMWSKALNYEVTSARAYVRVARLFS